MIKRSEREIAEFFGVEVEDISGSQDFTRLKGSRTPRLMALRLTIRAYEDAVQVKRPSSRRNKDGQGKGKPMFHGSVAKSRGERA